VIADDTISNTLTILAAVIPIYLSCFESVSLEVTFPLMVLLTSDFLINRTMKRIPDVDSVVGSGPEVEVTRKKILLNTLVAVVAIAVSGLAITKLLVPQQISVFGATSFGILMAVAEEVFFRKWATNFFVSRFSGFPPAGFVVSSAFFTAYHIARYGKDLSAMTYVFAGGMILCAVAWYSGRLSPVMLAHVINNVSATADLSAIFTVESLTLVAVVAVIYVVIKSLEGRKG